MIQAYKENSQFILILIILYVVGVWGGPVIYIIFPLVLGLFGLKGYFIELLIISVWMLILSDYVPVKNATHDDLQFAKDIKPIIPLFLTGFYFYNKHLFPPIPKLFVNFIPFFIISGIGLIYSIKIEIGFQKYLSYLLMYFSIPIYVNLLTHLYGKLFWKTLMTFIVWMLVIGIVLGIAVPEIGMLGGSRFKGILGNPNGLGIFVYLSFALWMILKEFKLIDFSRNENFFIFIILFISLIWCGSRNGLMSVFMFYMVYRLVKIHWSLALVLVVLVIVFQDLIFNSFLLIIDFFQLSDYFRVDSLEEGSGRKVAWLFAWTKIQDYFFIGGSFGHDENIMRPNYSWLNRLGHDGGVHNSYLSLWFDSGLIGVITYFFGFVKTVLSSVTKSYIGLAFMVSFFFNITYESWLVASLNPFTILMLIIITIFAQQFEFKEEN
jgi:hypothetical protein